MLIYAKFVIGTVVTPDDIRARPTASHLDAKVVVGMNGQVAGACCAFQQRLGQGDTGRYAVAVHLVNGGRGILVDVSLVF